ncbi:aspartate carbamoyltransferase regulatory subunit [Psychromonas sp. RZ22]|uniref:aspartate carbamoyltransferase regulatory subunit n=1 Tax=Psychromonas algarum TaxID=2555643 RepID=UPI0010689679|nr:aspartate carbamoyltransferase regulatory subunit [Psychromonas sp. RZ22]TEW55584.1 aspartate carbamoyltransferase regulatory subunit [Psychromonas sp. RZ22]
MQKKLQVEAIEQGSVIDHIPARQGVKILKFFKFTQTNEKITIGLNLATHNGKGKDLIKIENTFFNDQQANQLALFAPNATINQIKDFKVVNKFKVQLPSSFIDVLACPNSNCISHNEPVKSRFYVQQKKKLKLKCHYCEKSFIRSTFDELD